MTTTPGAYQLLVVDPCRDTQVIVTQQLQGRGYSVLTASDLTSAIGLIDSAAPDLIMTDLFLPERGGLTLLQELSARRAYCPVIAMAQEAPEQAIVEAIISWLIKTTASTFSPIRQLQLRGALQELLFNAVEHGNLEISGQEKHQALMEGRYEQLVAQRRSRAQLHARSVTLHILHDRAAGQMVYRITDEGAGFNWHSLFGRSQDVTESEAANGRGIFLTQALFPALVYNDRGNEVTLTVPLR